MMVKRAGKQLIPSSLMFHHAKADFHHAAPGFEPREESGPHTFGHPRGPGALEFLLVPLENRHLRRDGLCHLPGAEALPLAGEQFCRREREEEKGRRE